VDDDLSARRMSLWVTARRIHHQLRRERQLPEPPAGGVKDRVRDRRRDTHLPDPAHPLGPERIGALVGARDEIYSDIRGVGIDWDQILAQVAGAPAAMPGIHPVALQESLAESPQHAARQLAACHLRVEQPACGEHAEHPAHSHPTQLSIDGDLDEVRTKRQPAGRWVRGGCPPAAPCLGVRDPVTPLRLALAPAPVGQAGQDQPPVLHGHGRAACSG
jgi:hypothetical protein